MTILELNLLRPMADGSTVAVNISLGPSIWQGDHAECPVRGEIFPSDCQATGSDPMQALELGLRLARKLAESRGLTWPNGVPVAYEGDPSYPPELLNKLRDTGGQILLNK